MVEGIPYMLMGNIELSLNFQHFISLNYFSLAVKSFPAKTSLPYGTGARGSHGGQGKQGEMGIEQEPAKREYKW